MRALLLAVSWALCVSTSLAQGYPGKAVRFIVPYPPGGGTDMAARTISAKLVEDLGQQIIIDNRGGAQGSIGTAVAAKAPADGYTMLLSYVGTFCINPFLYKEVGYDPLKDFAHVSLATVQPYVVVVHPGVPAKSLKDLVVLAKTRPDRLTFASSASVGQLAGEHFKLLTKTKMLHVPYKGAGPAVIDLMGGHVDLMFSSPTSAVPPVKSGRLRALAVTAPTRLNALPEVPTSRESGYPEFEISGWYGVAVPANTPKEIVHTLNGLLARALKSNEVRERLIREGLEAKANSPEEMTALVKSEVERWGSVVKASGAKAE
ncbi:MAG: tripartite tricarboxylate transporter substrate binding protein [Burkholderiales bacterium]|nr:tripartite tricarboxylate transporter substrate binding protein [Burkholderiales bacterium]